MRETMTKTTARMFATAVIVGLFGLGGCGGSSSATALCQQGCDKRAACLGDDAASCKNNCSVADQVLAACSNKDAITSKARSCLSMSCSAFATCMADVPDCQTTGGGTGGSDSSASGGSSGTASGGVSGTASGGVSGTASGGASGTGSGGMTGSASCDVCAMANTCCIQLATFVGVSSSSCQYPAMCQSKTGADRDSYVSVCQQAVAGSSGLGLPGCP